MRLVAIVFLVLALARVMVPVENCLWLVSGGRATVQGVKLWPWSVPNVPETCRSTVPNVPTTALQSIALLVVAVLCWRVGKSGPLLVLNWRRPSPDKTEHPIVDFANLLLKDPLDHPTHFLDAFAGDPRGIIRAEARIVVMEVLRHKAR